MGGGLHKTRTSRKNSEVQREIKVHLYPKIQKYFKTLEQFNSRMKLNIRRSELENKKIETFQKGQQKRENIFC